ncbi:hypothetical protein, partial [Oribacterium sp. C9]|uniref:hypothetical protein n=1 Tax=Oribacterium sp. C9 TaxID=1943579 RepID=UPI0019808985
KFNQLAMVGLPTINDERPISFAVFRFMLITSNRIFSRILIRGSFSMAMRVNSYLLPTLYRSFFLILNPLNLRVSDSASIFTIALSNNFFNCICSSGSRFKHPSMEQDNNPSKRPRKSSL